MVCLDKLENSRLLSKNDSLNCKYLLSNHCKVINLPISGRIIISNAIWELKEFLHIKLVSF